MMTHMPGPNQERYLLAEALTEPVYMMPLAYRMKGHLDILRLKYALTSVCERHEALQTRFKQIGPTEYRALADPTPALLEVVDAGADSSQEIRASTIAYVMREPDFSAQSMRRFHLVRYAADDHVLTFAHHHAVSDGISLQIFLRELFAIYDGAEGLPLAKSYSAFHSEDWRTTRDYLDDERYWKTRDFAVDAIAPLLPDIADGWNGPPSDSIDVSLSPKTSDAVRTAAAEAGISTFAFVYATIAILMSRATGSTHVVSTFQSSGRRGLDGAENAIGPFSNALPLNHAVDDRAAFADFTRQLRSDMREAVAHEAFPYHHIMRTTGVHPQFGINAYPEMMVPQAQGLSIAFEDMLVRESDFDLNFRFFDRADGMAFTLYYAANRFSHARISLMGEQLTGLLAAFAEAPDAAIGSVRTPEPQQYGKSQKVRPVEALIHSRFLDHAKAHPKRTALSTPFRDYSYGDLARWTGAVADAVQGGLSGPIGILASRSAELVAAMIGVSRAGLAFAVLDPDYPDDRLTVMIKTAGIRSLLAGSEHGERAAEFATLVGIDAARIVPFRADEPTRIVENSGNPDDIAYLLFTSGSTGTPKCVATSHRPLVHFTQWQENAFQITTNDTITMLSGLGHDPVMRDIFLPLSVGACLAVPEGVDFFSPGALNDWLAATEATTLHLTPPLGHLLLQGHADCQPLYHIRRLFFGGDILRTALVNDMCTLCPDAQAINFYGATETPQAISYALADADAHTGTVPIGQAVPGFDLVVEDAKGHELARNEPGKLVVRSAMLSLGYVEGGELKAHLRDDTGVRIYDTGDRAYRGPDGDLRVIGRGDDQVKIRGFRVEPAEVASVLSQTDEVGPCEVLAVGQGRGNMLVAFVASSDSGWDEVQMRNVAAQKLPPYMVPQRWIRLDRIPLLPNGKVDRANLRQRAKAKQVAASAPAEPTSPVARQLIERWERALFVNGITPDQNFSELGGDSLSFVEISIASEELLGVLPERWETMSIAELAASKPRKLHHAFSFIDTAMFMRAVAILLVVVGHFRVFNYGGGATTAMFLVAGFLIGRLQLLETERQRSAKPFARLFLKVLIPVWLFSAALFAWRSVSADQPSLGMLLLTENFVDYAQYEGDERDGHDIFLWYVHCFLQMIAFVAFAVWLNLRRGEGRLSPLGLCAALLAIGIAGRFVLPVLWNPDFFRVGAVDMALETYVSPSHIGTLAIGMLCALAASESRRTQVAIGAVTLAYGVASALLYPSVGWMFLIGFAFVLMMFERMIIPKVLRRPAMILSGATLFIYLTHFQWRKVLQVAGVPDYPVLYAAGATLGGIGVWAGWQWGQSLVRRHVHLPIRKRRKDVIVDLAPKDIASDTSI